MEVRKLDTENLDEIKALFRSVFTKEPWNDDWSDEHQLTEYIRDLTENRNSLSLGLYDENRLIGLSLGSIMHWYSGKEYYIFEFCIEGTRQHQGIGTRFLNEIETYVKKMGVNHLFLQTEQNVPAFHFYKKNGFTEVEGHISFVKMLK